MDPSGAQELSEGLGYELDHGLINAGQAGATRTGGRASNNTLWGRLAGMHLGARSDFSTFRRSLEAILAARPGSPHPDEQALTEWMRRHLKIIAVPVPGRDALGGIESDVLGALDPPLNSAKVSRTSTRERLSLLHRTH